MSDSGEQPDNRGWEELAWKWFEYHATQRTTMFNYFIVVTGVLAAAFVASLEGEYTNLQSGIAASGIILAVIFWLLDVRNDRLVDLGEQAIAELERDHGLRPVSARSRIFSSHFRVGPSAWNDL